MYTLHIKRTLCKENKKTHKNFLQLNTRKQLKNLVIFATIFVLLKATKM